MLFQILGTQPVLGKLIEHGSVEEHHFQARLDGDGRELGQLIVEEIVGLAFHNQKQIMAMGAMLWLRDIVQLLLARTRADGTIVSLEESLALGGWPPEKRAEVLKDPWGMRYVHEPVNDQPGALRICSAGPDGKHRTEDDVCTDPRPPTP